MAKRRRKKPRGRGWFDHPAEHGLAARGIKTVIPGKHGTQPNIGYKNVGLNNPLKREYLLLVDEDVDRLVESLAETELEALRCKIKEREHKVTFPPARTATAISPIPVSEERLARVKARAEEESARIAARAEVEKARILTPVRLEPPSVVARIEAETAFEERRQQVVLRRLEREQRQEESVMSEEIRLLTRALADEQLKEGEAMTERMQKQRIKSQEKLASLQRRLEREKDKPRQKLIEEEIRMKKEELIVRGIQEELRREQEGKKVRADQKFQERLRREQESRDAQERLLRREDHAVKKPKRAPSPQPPPSEATKRVLQNLKKTKQLLKTKLSKETRPSIEAVKKELERELQEMRKKDRVAKKLEQNRRYNEQFEEEAAE